MSECTRMREALLEADLDVLAGRGDTPITEHLRSCASCAAAAAHIVRATAALDSALSARPPLDARILVARARAEAGPAPAPSGATRRRPPVRWAALAAAASLAALLVWAERDRPLPGTPWAPIDAPPATVETASGDVAVIETDDPDITVIWIF